MNGEVLYGTLEFTLCHRWDSVCSIHERAAEECLVAMPTFYGDLWITHIPMGTSVLFTTGGGIYDARSQDFFLVFIPRLPRGSSNDPICIRNINERGKSRSDFKQLLSEFPFSLQMCIWRLKFYIYLSLSHVQFHSSHTIFLLHICHSFYAVNYLSLISLCILNRYSVFTWLSIRLHFSLSLSLWQQSFAWIGSSLLSIPGFPSVLYGTCITPL